MKIGLIGYGKMGKTIERLAKEKGHLIVAIVSSSSSSSEWEKLSNADVCIEFTRPEVAVTNYSFCFVNNIPVVTGTTGWNDQFDAVSKLCKAHNGSFFHASNFSIGVNIFWQINKQLAEIMSSHPDYSASMKEIHHTQKLDEPSGTAITTAQQIVEKNDAIKGWKLSKDGPTVDELPIDSLREGDVKGTHIVTYNSAVDQITISHEAKSRDGFALGSILAAEYLVGKKGMHTMDDLLG